MRKKNTINLSFHTMNMYLLPKYTLITWLNLSFLHIGLLYRQITGNSLKLFGCIPLLPQGFSLLQKNINNHSPQGALVLNGHLDKRSLKVFRLRVGFLITAALLANSRPNTSRTVPSIDPSSHYIAGPLSCTVIAPTLLLESMEMIIDFVFWQANVALNHLCTLQHWRLFLAH